MAITPQTNLKLLKCNLNLDEQNQLNFASKTAQYNYFNSLTKIEASNFTYQRKDNVIRYPAHIDSIIEYNYCMYQNSNYSNKWFYAYITRMEYVNDNMTHIYIKTDPYQTWQFDITFMRSFVEREHVNDDTIGSNTVPEGLETGEYVYGFYSIPKGINMGSSHVVMATTVSLQDGSNAYGYEYSNVYSGLRYWIFKTINDVNLALQYLDSLGKADSVNALFIAPDTLTGWQENGAWIQHDGDYQYKYIEADPPDPTTPLSSFQVIKYNAFVYETEDDLYTPKNNKLFTYPFHFFTVTNNVGTTAEFHYEDFYQGLGYANFYLYGALTVGCSIKAVPTNYKDIGNSAYNLPYQDGIVCGKFPTCSWNTDVYTNWLTQNAINLISEGATATAGILGGAIGLLVNPLVGAGALAGGLKQTESLLGQVYEHSITPPQAKGSMNSGDITYSLGYTSFGYYIMQPKKEWARRIDNFFSMYGYKTNLTKVPNLTGRTNWNFVKCIDVNIEGYIPQEDLQEIKDMFNNGVTIWHNPSTFLDYSQSNAII